MKPAPSPLKTPAEFRELKDVWRQPGGLGMLTAVNNTWIGLFYIGAALLFMLLAGILALVMRGQLALPGIDLVDYDTYNQLFTMHGTVMMFLFAVPVIEAIGVLMLPAMVAARDLPFPRLSAYAFWAYFVGGLVFFGTLFFDLAPDGGWFMYPPLTSSEYSPGLRSDFWLLGIGFIEISAIAGAIEIIVGLLRTRAPGMTLSRMPVYAWAMLVVGFMIVFAFPPVIAATALLELERAFDWPFFIAERGGDSVLWQHLFWLFGHPDVYIIFLPAAGIVSTVVPAMAGTPLAAYRWVVGSVIATGAISFALWVHHMFAVGMPHRAASFFSAASMLVAVPAGIQVFAWIATFMKGRVQRAAPTWFILGFFGIFVLGGLTGVMVAAVPYDWQVHDTYFVVAHLHYVLLGGLVFPMLAGIYYWAPTVSGKKLSERMGAWACALLFIGVNLTFFPMHIAGLLGMPRRVWTYPAGLGWDLPNLLSSIGAGVIASGFLLVLIDIVLRLRPAGRVDVNPWNGPTLEWLPLDNYASRSIPLIASREPLWDNPKLREEVDRGDHFLPGVATGGRETIVTTAIDARPEYILKLPGPSWLPPVAAVFTAVFFFLLTVKQLAAAGACAAIVLGCVLAWLWQSDPPSTGRQHEVGGKLRLPDSIAGPRSHSWWAVVVLILVFGAIFASFVFSYYYLWSDEAAWPATGAGLPGAANSWLAALGWIAGSGALLAGGRALARDRRLACGISVAGGLVALAFATTLTAWAVRDAGAPPSESAYGAMLHVLLSWQALHAAMLAVMGFYVMARLWRGMVDRRRRATFDNTWLMWHYVSAQGLLTLLVFHSPAFGS